MNKSIEELMAEISKRIGTIRDIEKDYPQQFTLRGLACAVIKAVAVAEGKSVEEVIEDVKRYMASFGEV